MNLADVECRRLRWPLSVLRLRSADPARLVKAATEILAHWRGYSDAEAGILAETDAPHNTITPIARRRGELYELDLVLRNNITTDEHPMGVYHPHAEYHHIKKENIGLIEVMGLAVLPSRLKTEMAELEQAILSGADIRANDSISKHADWVDEWRADYDLTSPASVREAIQTEIGRTFAKILGCAGVYKNEEDFMRFIGTL